MFVLLGLGTVLALIDCRLQQGQSLIHVQCRPHAGQRHSQLDERDCDGRPHPDHDRPRIEDARHRGDVREHAADERVDDLERRDVDQDAARARVGVREARRPERTSA